MSLETRTVIADHDDESGPRSDCDFDPQDLKFHKLCKTGKIDEGSVRDGVLICHWHHWEFDLKTGGCFLTSGDDVRGDDLFVGIPAGAREAAQRRLIDRGKRALEQGLKDSSAFLITKAVTALREAGAAPKEIIQHGLFYGAHKTSEGWSSGIAILALAANLWDDVNPTDHNLFLVHGLTQIANRTSGSSRRQWFPFPRAVEEPDLDTMRRWFRRYIDLRQRGAAERILLTMNDRGMPAPVIADLIFTTATDFYFTGDGHALDFASKMFEALDYIDWQGSHEILRPIIVDLVSRTRHEETSRWADSVPVLDDFSPASTRSGRPTSARKAFSTSLPLRRPCLVTTSTIRWPPWKTHCERVSTRRKFAGR